MLTEILLPENVPGRLFRSPMPGCDEWPLDIALKAIARRHVEIVVCLAPMHELRTFSPRYARMVFDEALPWETWNELVLPDGGLPDDEEEFFDLAQDIAEELRGGAHVLIHCYAGIGRTGTLAICALLALGCSLEEARAAVGEAGAGPETAAQRALVLRAAAAFAPDVE